MKNRIVSLGGGLTSTGLLPLLVKEKYPNDNIVLLIAVIKNEHPDVWKMCDKISEKTGIPVTYITYDPETENKYRVINKYQIQKSMTVWDVFHEQKMIGNSIFDVCSSKMKRDILKKYILDHYNPSNTVIHLGITHDEKRRMLSIYKNWTEGLGYKVKADLIQVTKSTSIDKQKESMRIFGFVPELYSLGFSHNNCGGFCVKAGKSHFKRLLDTSPETYKYHEEQELKWQQAIGKDNTILRETRNGVKHRITLKELRERLEKTKSIRWSEDEETENLEDFSCNACEVF